MRPAVPYCVLLDVIGTPRTNRGIMFVPALLSIDQPVPVAFWLHEWLSAPFRKSNPSTTRDSCIWSQIAELFEFCPLLCFEDDDQIPRPRFDVGFVAVQQSESAPFLAAWPLACVVHVSDIETYGAPDLTQLGLVFSAGGPAAEIKHKIADAFWSLLIWANLEEDVHSYESLHLAALQRPEPCDDCEGTGLEGECLFQLREPCATCGGSGMVSWRWEQRDRRGNLIRDEYADGASQCLPPDDFEMSAY